MYVYDRTRVSYRVGEEVPWDSSLHSQSSPQNSQRLILLFDRSNRDSVLQPSRTVTLCLCTVFRNTNFGLCFIWNKHPAIILEILDEGEAFACHWILFAIY